MIIFLHWLSLIILSFGIIFIGRWVKNETQVYALAGLTIVMLSLIIALDIF